MAKAYIKWLTEHLKAARVRYEEVCKLDDHELASGGTSQFYEQAHQMFGYIGALEKCLREAGSATPGARTRATTKIPRRVKRKR